MFLTFIVNVPEPFRRTVDIYQTYNIVFWSVLYVTDPWILVFHAFTLIILRAWSINRWVKNSVRKLQYGPRTRLVRGYIILQVQLKKRVGLSMQFYCTHTFSHLIREHPNVGRFSRTYSSHVSQCF